MATTTVSSTVYCYNNCTYYVVEVLYLKLVLSGTTCVSMLPQSRGIAKRTCTTCASLLLVATYFPATKYVVDASCPAIGDALRLVIIGNSYTGGTSVGRACDDNEPGEPACHNMAVPGDVANFDVATYQASTIEHRMPIRWPIRRCRTILRPTCIGETSPVR